MQTSLKKKITLVAPGFWIFGTLLSKRTVSINVLDKQNQLISAVNATLHPKTESTCIKVTFVMKLAMLHSNKFLILCKSLNEVTSLFKQHIFRFYG